MKARILDLRGYNCLTKVGDIVPYKRVGGHNFLELDTNVGKFWACFSQEFELLKDEPKDPIVKSVLKKYKQRSKVGIEKYGTTLDREDLTDKEWFTHLQEELMDATLYVERILKRLDERK